MTAWRAASKLVPEEEGLELGQILKHQLGRGDFEVQHALSRAFCAIGDSILGLLEEASRSTNEKVQEHARFTLTIFHNPWSERKLALEFAKRVDTLAGTPTQPDLL